MKNLTALLVALAMILAVSITFTQTADAAVLDSDAQLFENLVDFDLDKAAQVILTDSSIKDYQGLSQNEFNEFLDSIRTTVKSAIQETK